MNFTTATEAPTETTPSNCMAVEIKNLIISCPVCKDIFGFEEMITVPKFTMQSIMDLHNFWNQHSACTFGVNSFKINAPSNPSRPKGSLDVGYMEQGGKVLKTPAQVGVKYSGSSPLELIVPAQWLDEKNCGVLRDTLGRVVLDIRETGIDVDGKRFLMTAYAQDIRRENAAWSTWDTFLPGSSYAYARMIEMRQHLEAAGYVVTNPEASFKFVPGNSIPNGHWFTPFTGGFKLEEGDVLRIKHVSEVLEISG